MFPCLQEKAILYAWLVKYHSCYVHVGNGNANGVLYHRKMKICGKVGEINLIKSKWIQLLGNLFFTFTLPVAVCLQNNIGLCKFS